MAADSEPQEQTVSLSAASARTSANTGALVAPVNGNVNLLSLKNNFIHLIHQADISFNNKNTGEDLQQFTNIAKHFTDVTCNTSTKLHKTTVS